ncbi:HipA family kinase [Streptacidiphilus monticola]|uniref:HipA family kinase n=1 Tax=Streptacidiphilus monticola TaxID=2161674 RepID=A0ABW1G7M6_9ACTN
MARVRALHYLAPLRSGGSVPGIVETSDFGTYVVKFVGAAQGRKALVAEVIVGELGRRLGLRVPELVLVDFDPAVAAHEPDQEVQDLLSASGGRNLGMDFLPGAVDFRPGDGGGGHAAGPLLDLTPEEAGRVVWFDALVQNVDRTVHSPNLMVWHRRLWLIDHGAALVFHHRWDAAADAVARRYPLADHALGGYGPEVARADEELRGKVTAGLLREVVAEVPDEWLADEPGFAGPTAVRAAYVDFLAERAARSGEWLPGPFATAEQLQAEERARKARTAAGRPDWLQFVR